MGSGNREGRIYALRRAHLFSHYSRKRARFIRVGGPRKDGRSLRLRCKLLFPVGAQPPVSFVFQETGLIERIEQIPFHFSHLNLPCNAY